MNASTTQSTTSRRLLRLPDVENRVGFKRTAIYRKIRQGTFPRPVPIGSASRWIESEVDAWIADHVTERDRDHPTEGLSD